MITQALRRGKLHMEIRTKSPKSVHYQWWSDLHLTYLLWYHAENWLCRGKYTGPGKSLQVSTSSIALRKACVFTILMRVLMLYILIRSVCALRCKKGVGVKSNQFVSCSRDNQPSGTVSPPKFFMEKMHKKIFGTLPFLTRAEFYCTRLPSNLWHNKWTFIGQVGRLWTPVLKIQILWGINSKNGLVWKRNRRSLVSLPK